MKLSVEDFLHNIDLFFKDKSQKDIYLIYTMIFGIIFSFSYLFLWDMARESFYEIKQKISFLETELTNDKNYLKQNPQIKIIQLDKDINIAKTQIKIHKQNNNYIKTKIQSVSSLIYDEIAWGEYLHSISKKANNNNIKIIKLTNKYNIKKQSFGHMLDITINIHANYLDTLEFINSLEKSDLVVDIHGLGMKQEDKLYTDLNISVWGIAY